MNFDLITQTANYALFYGYSSLEIHSPISYGRGRFFVFQSYYKMYKYGDTILFKGEFIYYPNTVGIYGDGEIHKI